jgi:WD domain, G-beta repeat/TIR domain
MAGGIFINYRRGDDPGHTGRLFDHLQQVFPPEHLFMDVDTIAPGLDFVRVLQEAVAKCDVFLAVIGKGWVDARDASGARRLDNLNDIVRLEIESALSQEKRVIPVLIGEVQMPESEILPAAIKPLARRHAFRLTHERFRTDAQALVKVIQQALLDVEALRASQAEAAKRAQLATLQPAPVGEAVLETRAAKGVIQHGEPSSEIRRDVSRAPASPHKRRSSVLKNTLRVFGGVALFGIILLIAELMNFRLLYVTYAYWAYSPTRTLMGKHSTAVSALAFSPNGKTFASGGDDFRVRVWNTENLEENFLYEAGDKIRLLAYSPNGKWLAVQTGQLTTNPISVQLLDAVTGVKGPLFSGGASGERALAFSPDLPYEPRRFYTSFHV